MINEVARGLVGLLLGGYQAPMIEEYSVNLAYLSDKKSEIR